MADRGGQGRDGPSTSYESLGERTLSLQPLEECCDDELQVMVDLEGANDGGLTTGYVSYRVSTVSTLKRFKKPRFSVLRRFSDFVWLRERLRHFWPGLIIPPLPAAKRLESNYVSSQTEIEQQRSVLEAFLTKVCAHALLRESSDLTLFLEEGGKAWANALAWYERGPVIAAAGALNTFFARMTTQADSMIAGTATAGAAAEALVQEDFTYLEAAQYILSLEEILSALSAQAEQLVEDTMEVAEANLDVDHAATALGRTVVDHRGEDLGAPGDTGLGFALLQVGLVSRELGEATREHASALRARLLHPLGSMLGLVAAIREVMDDRALAFRRMQAACAKLELRREYAAEAEAAAAKDGGAASAEGRSDLMRDEAEAAAARDEQVQAFELIAARMAAELPRMHADIVKGLQGALRAFSAVEAEIAGRKAAAWDSLLPGCSMASPGPGPGGERPSSAHSYGQQHNPGHNTATHQGHHGNGSGHGGGHYPFASGE